MWHSLRRFSDWLYWSYWQPRQEPPSLHLETSTVLPVYTQGVWTEGQLYINHYHYLQITSSPSHTCTHYQVSLNKTMRPSVFPDLSLGVNYCTSQSLKLWNTLEGSGEHSHSAPIAENIISDIQASLFFTRLLFWHPTSCSNWNIPRFLFERPIFFSYLQREWKQWNPGSSKIQKNWSFVSGRADFNILKSSQGTSSTDPLGETGLEVR